STAAGRELRERRRTGQMCRKGVSVPECLPGPQLSYRLQLQPRPERKSGPRSEPETFSQTRQHLRRPGIYSARWPRLWPPGNTRCPPLLVIAVARRLLATSARNRGPLSFVRGKQRWHSWYPKRSCRHPEVVWPPPDVFPSQRRHSAPRRLQLIAEGSPRDSASAPAPVSGLL